MDCLQPVLMDWREVVMLGAAGGWWRECGRPRAGAGPRSRSRACAVRAPGYRAAAGSGGSSGEKPAGATLASCRYISAGKSSYLTSLQRSSARTSHHLRCLHSKAIQVQPTAKVQILAINHFKGRMSATLIASIKLQYRMICPISIISALTAI